MGQRRLRRGWGGEGGDEKEIAGATSDINLEMGGQIQDTTTRGAEWVDC